MAQYLKTRTPGIYRYDGKRGTTFFLDKLCRGQPICGSLGVVTYEQAKDELRRRETELLSGRVPEHRNVRSLTVTDILEYWADKHLRHLDSKEKRVWLLDSLDAKMGPITYPQLNRSAIERYKRERAGECKRVRYKNKKGDWDFKQGKPIGGRTIQAELAELSMAINLMVDDEILPYNPVSRFCRVKLPDPEKIVIDDGIEGWGDGGEWQEIYDNACSNKGLFAAIYESGMRPGEVLAMRSTWIKELTADCWVIAIPRQNEKTGKVQREVPASERLQAILRRRYRPGTDRLVFPSSVTGEERKDLSSAWDGTIGRAELTGKGYTPYALRRTRITIWDAIDSNASRFATGHSISGKKDVHLRNYVKPTYQRMFRLVGIEYRPALTVISRQASA